jgi:VanZ family protein
MRMDTPSAARRALVWLPPLAWAALIFWLSSQPSDALPNLGVWADLAAGAAHFTVYALLMALLLGALRRGASLADRQRWLLAFALVALYGLSDEFHQSFVPGRDPALLDWLTDVAGATLAWWVSVRRQRG